MSMYVCDLISNNNFGFPPPKKNIPKIRKNKAITLIRLKQKQIYWIISHFPIVLTQKLIRAHVTEVKEILNSLISFLRNVGISHVMFNNI